MFKFIGLSVKNFDGKCHSLASLISNLTYNVIFWCLVDFVEKMVTYGTLHTCIFVNIVSANCFAYL